MRAAAASMSAARETSAEIPTAFTPCARPISRASRSTRCWSRATMATSTPSEARAWATARPMPMLPPVMTARLPFKFEIHVTPCNSFYRSYLLLYRESPFSAIRRFGRCTGLG